MCLRGGGKRGTLLVPHVHPLDFAGLAQGIGKPVQRVPDYAIDAFDPRLYECRHHVIRACAAHFVKSSPRGRPIAKGDPFYDAAAPCRIPQSGESVPGRRYPRLEAICNPDSS